MGIGGTFGLHTHWLSLGRRLWHARNDWKIADKCIIWYDEKVLKWRLIGRLAGGPQWRTREMLDEKATLENITYKNGKVYSKKDHQKAIENLTKGRIISAQRRKAEPTISKISRNLRYYMKGEGQKIFNQPIPLKLALKYGLSKDEKRPKWYLLVQIDMANRAVYNHSLSAIEIILRIDNWLMDKRQEKWERRFKRREEKWLAKRNKENVD